MGPSDVEEADRWARSWIANHVSSDGPFEHCNYIQLDTERMLKLLETVYADAAKEDATRIFTNARTIGGPCSFDYRADYGNGAHLSFSFVVSPPANGALERFRELGFSYLPNNGYQGLDKFVIKLCGSLQGRVQVCFDTTVVVEVRCVGSEECGGPSVPATVQRRF